MFASTKKRATELLNTVCTVHQDFEGRDAREIRAFGDIDRKYKDALSEESLGHRFYAGAIYLGVIKMSHLYIGRYSLSRQTKVR